MKRLPFSTYLAVGSLSRSAWVSERGRIWPGTPMTRELSGTLPRTMAPRADENIVADVCILQKHGIHPNQYVVADLAAVDHRSVGQ